MVFVCVCVVLVLEFQDVTFVLSLRAQWLSSIDVILQPTPPAESPLHMPSFPHSYSPATISAAPIPFVSAHPSSFCTSSSIPCDWFWEHPQNVCYACSILRELLLHFSNHLCPFHFNTHLEWRTLNLLPRAWTASRPPWPNLLQLNSALNPHSIPFF